MTTARITALAFCLFSLPVASGFPAAPRAVSVERYKTLELIFTANTSPSNPFDTYLLKLEVTDPVGTKFTVEGFYDGNGNGGQSGKIWKARLCPTRTGTWSWRTVAGDAPDSGLSGLSGTFTCTSGSDRGGIIAQGAHFKFQNGGPVTLVGNFLDFTNGLRTTHTYMSETTSNSQRDAIITRHRDFHTANKANIYFANKGDYGSQSVTPWVGTASSNDKTKMDLARWRNYDSYIRRFKDNSMLAEMWFFADDSGFGGISEAHQKRLIRYGMARTSAFTHTFYVLALEWGEGFSIGRVNSLGNYVQTKNPWGREVSVHNHEDWQFGGQSWPTFIATQDGNSAPPTTVNKLARDMRSTYSLPHIDEEYGVLNSNSITRLRSNLWANFTGGAAGGGTGSDLKALQRFLNQSRVPFQRMSSKNNLVSGGGSSRYCLAETGRHYVVYSESGSFNLNVTGSSLTGRWFNPRSSSANLTSSFSVSSGNPSFTPPGSTSSDWVLWVTDGSNLNGGVTHPSTGATVVQETVSQSSNQAPTVMLTAPSGGSSFVQGTQVTVSASAADSDGTISKVEFFDGGSLIGQDTSPPYSTPWDTSGVSIGNHTLTARATDNGGATTTSSPVTVTITATTNQPPTIGSFTVSPTSLVAGSSATFSLSASDADDGTLSYEIDVDDDGTPEKTGTLSSGSTVTYAHTFGSAGTFTARATVTDSAPQSASATTSLTAVAPLSAAQIIPSTTSGSTPLTVRFGASQTGGLPPYSYSWVFGDGATNPGPGNDVNHTYTTAGTYTAQVTVTDSNGDFAGDSAVITVTDPTGSLISNTTPTNYAWSALDVGATQYVDRTFTFSAVPAAYVGLDFLKTANDDKGSSGFPWITFDVSQSVTVTVAHDDRFPTKPAWMGGFLDTGDDLVSGGGTFSLWSVVVPAGTVSLGGNNDSGQYVNSMYSVVVGPATGAPTDTDGDGLSDADEINIYGTDPSLADTDGDGMDDGDEVQYSLDPLDSDQDGNGVPDGLDDWNGNGIDNQTDIANGTNPGTPPAPGPGPGPGPTGKNSGSSGGCGATGMEILLILGLLAFRRR